MTAKTLTALVVLNVALLAGLLLTGGPQRTAQAQFGGAPNFLMIAGEVRGSDRDAVYLFEATSGELRVIQYSSADDRLNPIARRNIARDVQATGSR
ncbi:MAG: hypothetical protein ACOC1G_07570 [Phycisphaeraceae bacterium]